MRRIHRPGADRRALAGIETIFEAARQFGEILPEAPRRVGRIRRLARDHDRPGAHQPLDLGHRRQQTLALWVRERRENRARERVRQPLVGGELGAALGGQRDAPDPRVALPPDDFDQPLGGKRAQQAAQIAGIEAERAAQAARVGAGEADLEDQPRLAERPAAAEIALVERADPAGDKAVEAADLLDSSVGHSLTLVRECGLASAWTSGGGTSLTFETLTERRPEDRSRTEAAVRHPVCANYGDGVGRRTDLHQRAKMALSKAI